MVPIDLLADEMKNISNIKSISLLSGAKKSRKVSSDGATQNKSLGHRQVSEDNQKWTAKAESLPDIDSLV